MCPCCECRVRFTKERLVRKNYAYASLIAATSCPPFSSVRVTHDEPTQQSNSPKNSPFGSALLMNVNTSSVGPIVTFVTTGEFTAASDRLYGICPPYTRKPTGWHVSTGFVTFVTMVMFTEGRGEIQESVLPAKHWRTVRGQRKWRRKTE